MSLLYKNDKKADKIRLVLFLIGLPCESLRCTQHNKIEESNFVPLQFLGIPSNYFLNFTCNDAFVGRSIVSRMNAATLSIVCPKKLVDVTTLTSNTYGDVWNDARVYWFFRFGFLITWVKGPDLDQTSLPCTHTLYD